VRIVVDTNVVLDHLLARQPFVENAARIVGMAERGDVDAYLCATTVTTVDYLLGQALPDREARAAVRKLLAIFDVAPVNRPVLEAAVDGVMPDFEDAVIAEAARAVAAERIVTRNTRDFARSPVTACDPAEFLAQIKLGAPNGQQERKHGS